MNLTELQGAVYKYIKSNPLFLILLQFSKILVFIYPIYQLVSRLPFLQPVTTIIGHINPIIYALYLIGLLLCFAKREMLCISGAFWLRAIAYIISMVRYDISINYILWIILYGILGLLAFTNANNSNHTTTI